MLEYLDSLSILKVLTAAQALTYAERVLPFNVANLGFVCRELVKEFYMPQVTIYSDVEVVRCDNNYWLQTDYTFDDEPHPSHPRNLQAGMIVPQIAPCVDKCGSHLLVRWPLGDLAIYSYVVQVADQEGHLRRLRQTILGEVGGYSRDGLIQLLDNCVHGDTDCLIKQACCVLMGEVYAGRVSDRVKFNLSNLATNSFGEMDYYCQLTNVESNGTIKEMRRRVLDEILPRL